MANHIYRKTDGHLIDEATAKRWINAYRDIHSMNTIRSYFFGSEIIQKILDHKDVVGIRVCLGIEDNKLQMVLVGTNTDGNYVWLGETALDGSGGDAGNGGFPCPPYCPDDN